jgi:magnesium chelatase family protein
MTIGTVQGTQVIGRSIWQTGAGQPSAAVRGRIEKAREIERQRFAGEAKGNTRLLTNADMGPAEVRDYCRLDDAGKSLLRAAMSQLGMSARAFHRILKLALTIADLEGGERIETEHLAEAIQYRPSEKAVIVMPENDAPRHCVAR